MTQEANDGSSYLQALRQANSSPEERTGNLQESLSRNRGTSGAVRTGPNVEKRRSPRHRIESSAEIQEDGSTVRMWVKCSDISRHGCYLEAAATYPAGTLLALKLTANGFQVSAKGVVRVVYPSLGMGVAFTDISAESRILLGSLLETISRR